MYWAGMWSFFRLSSSLQTTLWTRARLGEEKSAGNISDTIAVAVATAAAAAAAVQ